MATIKAIVLKVRAADDTAVFRFVVLSGIASIFFGFGLAYVFETFWPANRQLDTIVGIFIGGPIPVVMVFAALWFFAALSDSKATNRRNEPFPWGIWLFTLALLLSSIYGLVKFAKWAWYH